MLSCRRVRLSVRYIIDSLTLQCGCILMMTMELHVVWLHASLVGSRRMSAICTTRIE
jgi:hypothetical protein